MPDATALHEIGDSDWEKLYAYGKLRKRRHYSRDEIHINFIEHDQDRVDR